MPNLDQLAQLSQRLQEQEAQLRQTRQDLLAIINASPEAIFLMRPDGAVILANEALARRVCTPVAAFTTFWRRSLPPHGDTMSNTFSRRANRSISKTNATA